MSFVEWIGDELAAPLATGVAVGLALRAAVIPGELNDHDARAGEIQNDLIRWVADRDRQLEAEIINARNWAHQGVIEDVVMTPVPDALKPLPPGDLGNSGAFVGRIGRLMERALWEYRDEASAKVSEFQAMARREGWFHRGLRWRRGRPEPLRLSDDGRAALGRWRRREIALAETTEIAEPQLDRTQQPDAADIAALESDGIPFD